MKKILIQTDDQKINCLIEEWRKTNNNISEKLTELIIAAINADLATI